LFKKYSAIALSLMLAAIAASTFLTAEKSNTGKINGEFINPGAPFSPTGLGDWFKTGIEDSENPELSEVLSRVRYSILLRSQGGQLVVPTRIFVQPQSLAPDGRIVEGFSFCYGDRIQLMVDPVSAPLDIQELVSEEFTPNTRGEAKVHFKTQVRGVEGASREAGIQKWESGIENHYPSTMQWTVKGEGDIPYILYTLAGDLPVAELKEMAASLVRVEKGNIKPNND
jgi:hypothetical protein